MRQRLKDKVRKQQKYCQPMRMIAQSFDRRGSLPYVPKLDLAVVTTGGHEVLLVRVEVQTPHQVRVGVFDGVGRPKVGR